MKTVILMSDTHIPRRASKIPVEFMNAIVGTKPDLILHAGDVEGEDVVKLLKGIAPLKVVQGNMDWLDLPQHEVVEVEGLKIGLLHGKQVHPRGDEEQLYGIAKKLGVTILVSGHTHRMRISKFKDVWLINPGTITGGVSGEGLREKPTFIIMKVNGSKFELKKHELN